MSVLRGPWPGDEDPLSASRGIVVGFLVGIALWAVGIALWAVLVR